MPSRQRNTYGVPAPHEGFCITLALLCSPRPPQLVSWGATLVVVRILTPADYGLVGMALIAVGIAQLVGERRGW